MILKIGVAFLSLSLFITGCGGSSGSSTPVARVDLETFNIQGFKSSREISSNEYSQVTSGWISDGCNGGFSPRLTGNVFRFETSLSRSGLSFNMTATETVTSATDNQVRTEMKFDQMDISGFSGTLYVENRAGRICNFTSNGSSTNLDCNQEGQLTPEGIAFVQNIPPDPDENCTYRENLPDENGELAKPRYFVGTYYFENGQRVTGYMEKSQWISSYECSGQIQKRITSFVSVRTNQVKAYPGDSLCSSQISYRAVVQNESNHIMRQSSERYLQMPLK